MTPSVVDVDLSAPPHQRWLGQRAHRDAIRELVPMYVRDLGGIDTFRDALSFYRATCVSAEHAAEVDAVAELAGVDPVEAFFGAAGDFVRSLQLRELSCACRTTFERGAVLRDSGRRARANGDHRAANGNERQGRVAPGTRRRLNRADSRRGKHMAWPKRGTRNIVVDGQPYLWHYDGCCLFCSGDVITVGRAGAAYVLFLDPLVWSFKFRPASVASAIRWATQHDWSPERGPTRGMAFDERSQEFAWLADGQRHALCKPPG